MTNVYGYTRLNKARVRPKDFGIKRQTQMIKDYAEANDYKLKKVLSDTENTSVSLELPGLQRILQMAENGEIDLLLVARLDRITRAIRQLNHFIQKLHDHNVRLICIEEGLDSNSEDGKLALRTIDIISKWDYKMISDRTKELIERKKEVGERVGHAPFGFVYQNKKLVPYHNELKIVYLIRDKRDSDSLSYHKIAKYLNDRGIPSKRGGRWYAETVKTIYENVLYDDDELKRLVN